MAIPLGLRQASLSLAILLSTVGTYMSASSPNPPPPGTPPATGDTIRQLLLQHDHAIDVTIAPVVLLALHTSLLAWFYPSIPRSLLLLQKPTFPQANDNSNHHLNPRLITWSPLTAIPLLVNLCLAVPLRLASYASLGKNFTFTLAEPDRLETSGLYQYVQHPSYTGLVLVLLSNVALLGRTDGALGCWAPSGWHAAVTAAHKLLVPVVLAGALAAVWTRVMEEEVMLRGEFGTKWEEWNARTARFVPGVF